MLERVSIFRPIIRGFTQAVNSHSKATDQSGAAAKGRTRRLRRRLVRRFDVGGRGDEELDLNPPAVLNDPSRDEGLVVPKQPADSFEEAGAKRARDDVKEKSRHGSSVTSSALC